MFGLNNILVYTVIAGFVLASISGMLYMWHYKPIKNLNIIIKIERKTNNELRTKIQDLKLKLENQKVLLQKCKDDAEVSIFETEFDTRGDNIDKLYEDYLNEDQRDFNSSIRKNNRKDKNEIRIHERFIF